MAVSSVVKEVLEGVGAVATVFAPGTKRAMQVVPALPLTPRHASYGEERGKALG